MAEFRQTLSPPLAAVAEPQEHFAQEVKTLTARHVDDVQFQMSCGVRPASAAASTAACRKVALVVGIDTYRSFGVRQDSVEDALKIKEVLSQLGYNVSTLFNQDATRANIDAAVRSLAGPASTPAFFVLFLSTLCFKTEPSCGGAMLAACHDSSVDAGETSFVNLSTVLDDTPSYLRCVICDPSYATTLQRVAIMNMLKAADATVNEGDPEPIEEPALRQPHQQQQQQPQPQSQAPPQKKRTSGGVPSNLPGVGVELADFSHKGIKGVKVVTTRAKGPAEKAGLNPGDVILAVRGRAVSTRGDFRSILQEFSRGDTVDATVAPSDGSPISTHVIHLE